MSYIGRVEIWCKMSLKLHPSHNMQAAQPPLQHPWLPGGPQKAVPNPNGQHACEAPTAAECTRNIHWIYGRKKKKKHIFLQISETERLEIKNTRLHHFANARNLILRFRRLPHSGNRLSRIQLCAISQMYGTRLSVSWVCKISEIV